ncbi:MAG TPA: PHP domain-containing protein [Chloroflexota bacterium]|nr:PHP domain-containing protein [Chloroflexota bacterium]
MIDLHTHTLASDGLLAPAELVNLALERGLSALAVTDHDSTEGVAEALAAAESTGLTVVPGVEMSAEVDEGECHILGYFVEHGPGGFQDTLRQLRGGRVSRARLMVERLADAGAPISWERVKEIAGDAAIARPHVAQALVEARQAASIAEAFERWIGSGRPGYVPRTRLTPADAIGAVVRAGGVAAIAHPILGAALVPGPARERALAGVEQQIEELEPVGLGGIEVYYNGYDPTLVGRLGRLAERFGLIATGGSDFHGPGRGHGELGTVPIPPDVARTVVGQLRRAAGRQRSGA